MLGHSADSQQILNGNALPTLLRFAAPIILGNIFQQLYNVVDAVVVGKYLGDLPLSGISVATPMLDIFNALILGSSIGVGVLAAQLCGAGDYDRLKRTHATALLGGCALTLVLSLAGILLGDTVLAAQGTEAAVRAEAMDYLTIVLGGLICCFVYNYYASMLRSCGDSRTPFLILLTSSLLHAWLDVLLAGVLSLGVRGVACSTVLCQLFAALWCLLHCEKNCAPLALKRGDLRFEPKLARLALSFAWAAALQQAVVCIGRFLIQGMLSPLGTNAVTGYNMGMRAEAFMLCLSQGVSAGAVVCISQCFGHGDAARVRRFHYLGLGVQLALGLCIGTACCFFPRQIIGIFSDNAEVIASGARYTGIMSYIYIFSCLGESIQGYFRGIGRLRLTMIASLLQIVLRVTLSSLLIPLWGIPGICVSVATGWCLLVVIEGSYSLKVARSLSLKN